MRASQRTQAAMATLAVALMSAAAAPAIAAAPSAGVRHDVDTLAGTATAGRGLGSSGARAAAAYLVQRLRALGLQPAGTVGFRQPFVASTGDSVVNLIAVLPAADTPAAGAAPAAAGAPGENRGHVLLGAHYDHLGVGGPSDPHPGAIYPGADDNASGVAGVLEAARVLSTTDAPRRRNIVIALFDGEEAGRLGSRYYAEHPVVPLAEVRAMINLDTVGRLDHGRLTVFGTGTAAELERVLKGVNVAFQFELTLIPRSSMGSDDLSFLEHGTPAVQLFTGANADYHRPSDTADKIDPDGLTRIAAFTAELARYLADRDEPLAFVPPGAEQAAAAAKPGGTQRRVSFGSIPDFQRSSGGVLLTGVLPGSPAEQAGLKAGDLLVEFGGTPIDNLSDYSEALKRYAPGDQVEVVYQRGEQRTKVQVTLVERK